MMPCLSRIAETLAAEAELEPDVEELKVPEVDEYFDDAIKLYLRDIQKTKLLDRRG